MNNNKYRILPPLTDEQRQALAEDIKKQGCTYPIIVDQEENIIDGHERYDACVAIGLIPVIKQKQFKTEHEKLEFIYKMNELRRTLGPIGKVRLIREICRLRGVRLGKGRQDEKSATIAQILEEFGYKKRTFYNWLELAISLDEHNDLCREVDAGNIDAKRALRIARDRKESNWIKNHTGNATIEGARIENCDFRDLSINDHSIDLIHTDPPYGKASIHLWRDIGLFSKRVLKPGKLLIIYTGQVCFNEAMKQLEESLRYVWVGAIKFSGGSFPSYYQYKIMSTFSPLLFMSNGEYIPNDWFNDGLNGKGPEKEHHPWQKQVGEAEYYIERLTKPGEVVLDFFLGSGTTAIAALKKGRNFVGCDINQTAIQIAKKRIEEELLRPVIE